MQHCNIAAAHIHISVIRMPFGATPSSDACARAWQPRIPLAFRCCIRGRSQILVRRYVARTEQGRGLGRQLFALALDWMRANSDGPGEAMWIGYALSHAA